MPETTASNIVSSVHCKLLLDSLICNTSFDVPCSMQPIRVNQRRLLFLYLETARISYGSFTVTAGLNVCLFVRGQRERRISNERRPTQECPFFVCVQAQSSRSRHLEMKHQRALPQPNQRPTFDKPAVTVIVMTKPCHPRATHCHRNRRQLVGPLQSGPSRATAGLSEISRASKQFRGASLGRKFLNFFFQDGAFWCTLYF